MDAAGPRSSRGGQGRAETQVAGVVSRRLERSGLLSTVPVVSSRLQQAPATAPPAAVVEIYTARSIVGQVLGAPVYTAGLSSSSQARRHIQLFAVLDGGREFCAWNVCSKNRLLKRRDTLSKSLNDICL